MTNSKHRQPEEENQHAWRKQDEAERRAALPPLPPNCQSMEIHYSDDRYRLTTFRFTYADSIYWSANGEIVLRATSYHSDHTLTCDLPTALAAVAEIDSILTKLMTPKRSK